MSDHAAGRRTGAVAVAVTLAVVALVIMPPTQAADLPIITDVEHQPLAAQAKRVAEALEYVGAPLPAKDLAALDRAVNETDAQKGVRGIQNVLDRHVVAFVSINPESRVKVAAGPAKPELMQQGWRTFLVKVHNDAGVTAELQPESPNADPLHRRSTGSKRPKLTVPPGEVGQRFLDIAMFNNRPLNKTLSGLELEYRIIQLFSRDTGKREAKLSFNVGQGTQDIGFRNEVSILFQCVPAVEVVLEVLDHDGKPTTGSFTFRDRFGRVYPAQSRRLAPDFFFHPQIYRASGESVLLPPGTYEVEYGRGPEYVVARRTVQVPDSVSHKESFRLDRWIHPAAEGWFSGDHHVHAAGCSHYESPAEGVLPGDMMRHILGEDLNVGCVLSWGPCWYFQKEFFEGKVNALSKKNYLMRYDVEVSGFPSQHCGHLCLLRLTEDDYQYPEEVEFDYSFGDESGHFKGTQTSRVGEWPSWDLPILQWGKRQNAVVGFSHSGWGLELPDYAPGRDRRVPRGKGRAADKLPDYAMPPFNGIGANEYVVDVAHDACDFISMVDTPSVWELNVWYHTLNCGFRCRVSGETDFPCIYGQKVGLGRSYVKLDGELDYDNWVLRLRDGRSYVSDGLSHLLDFQVGPMRVGERASNDSSLSELRLEKGTTVKVKARVAALLAESPNERIRARRLDEKPYWHIERARVGRSRSVPLELVVNGQAVATKEIEADGTVQDVEFQVPIERSSWVALRIFPSSHTNPVFVLVGGRPIRASRRSAQWCLQAVDQCWSQKVGRMREHELAAAQAAYDHAREVYRQILDECEVD